MLLFLFEFPAYYFLKLTCITNIYELTLEPSCLAIYYSIAFYTYYFFISILSIGDAKSKRVAQGRSIVGIFLM